MEELTRHLTFRGHIAPGCDSSGLGLIVPIRQQDARRIARRVVILPVPYRPDKCAQPHPTKDQRNRDQPNQDIHGYFIRIALSETEIDDSDIATADSSGVAKPNSAKGTAMTL